MVDMSRELMGLYMITLVDEHLREPFQTWSTESIAVMI